MRFAMCGFSTPRRTGAGRLLLPLLVLALMTTGCGSLGSSGYSVSGRVDWKGRPLEQGEIVFIPETAGALAVGASIREGRYELPNPPGLAPGRYRVKINSESGVDTRPGAPPDTHLANPASKE